MFLVLLTTFLYITTSVHSQFLPPNCSELCEVDRNEAQLLIEPESYPRFLPRVMVDPSGECARNPDIASWNASSRRFLSWIGMNDALFKCPRLKTLQRRRNESELPWAWREYLYRPVRNSGSKPSNQVPTGNLIRGVQL